MNTAVQRIRTDQNKAKINSQGNGENQHYASRGVHELPAAVSYALAEKARILVASENRLLRETLARILSRNGEIEVIDDAPKLPLDMEALKDNGANILLVASSGSLTEDVALLREVRLAVPYMKTLLLGMPADEGEFLQCVRAGVTGYLLRDASMDDVVEAVRRLHAGHAVCPGVLCSILFRYFEQETSYLPCASVQQRLGLTRREQQLVPLIAEGLTNKEIASRFCLSEQTIKNHLYRMKLKIGAENRLGIVQAYRTQGFLI